MRPPTKGDLTRDRILDATLETIAKSGFDSVSYESIATKAGVSRQLAQKYFPDRALWLQTVAQKAFQELLEAIDSNLGKPAPAIARLWTYLYTHIDWVHRSPKASSVLIPLLSITKSSPDVGNYHVETNRVGRERIALLLRDIELNGFIKKENCLKRGALEDRVWQIQTTLTGVITALLSDRYCTRAIAQKTLQSIISSILVQGWKLNRAEHLALLKYARDGL